MVMINRYESGGLNITKCHDESIIIVAPDQHRGYNDILKYRVANYNFNIMV